MLTEIVGNYLETGSDRFSHRMVSAGVLACLNIAPHSGTSVYPRMGVNEAKFSLIILSGSVPIAQIDNDHPIEISGGQFYGIHQHEFVSGSTMARIPMQNIRNIGEAGSFAQRLLEENS